MRIRSLVAAVAVTGVLSPLAVSPQMAAAQSSEKVSEKLPFDVPQMQGSMSGSSIGPAPTQYPGAPVPEPFSTEYLLGFESDISPYKYGVYLDVLSPFNDLRQRPELMQKDMDRAIEINNNAADDPELVRRAQIDAAADTGGVMVAVSDAMGEQLGEAFRQALEENRLPKTQYLMGNGYAARAGGLASSTFIEKEYYDRQRPHIVAPDAIKRYNTDDKDFYLDSPAFPSGHTNQAMWITTLMAYMMPEIGPQLIYRGAESGYHRIVMGVHYPLDVIGGYMMGQAAASDRLNDPRMRDAIDQAAEEVRAELEWRTGKTISELVAEDSTYISDEVAAEKFGDFMTMDFDPIYDQNAPMQVPQTAPALLAGAYPELNYEQRAEVLRQTALPAGHPMDQQGEGGSWQRLNIVAAMAADVTVNPDGSVTVN